jgi:class 3 adenylate cyclase
MAVTAVAEAALAEVDDFVEVKSLGERSLKGFPKPVPVLQVVRLKENATSPVS